MSCRCYISLSSVVCDCDISLSYLLTFNGSSYIVLLVFSGDIFLVNCLTVLLEVHILKILTVWMMKSPSTEKM